MDYWIKYDQTDNKVTDISQQDMSSQGWPRVYVNMQRDDFFKNNFNEVIYQSDYNALVFPDDIGSEMQLKNNNSYAYNSLVDSYNAGVASNNTLFNNISQSVNNLSQASSNSFNSLSDGIKQATNAAQVKEGKNYLNANQQNDLHNYFLTNTPLALNNLFDNLPVTNIPISLLITIDSINWKYIVPQFASMNDVIIQDNNIIMTGKSVDELKQIINNRLAQKDGTIWAVLHYGDGINITRAGLYYGNVPIGKNLDDVISDVSDLQNTITLLKNVVSSNSKGAQSGTNYLPDNVKQELLDDLIHGTDFNLIDIFNNVPTLNGNVTLSITANSPSWDYVTKQLTAQANVTVNDNNVLINGEGVLNLQLNVNKQLSHNNSKNVWAILHYGDNVTISDASLKFS